MKQIWKWNKLRIGTNFEIGKKFKNWNKFWNWIFFKNGTNFENETTFKLEEITKLEQITNWNEFRILKCSDYSIKKKTEKKKDRKKKTRKNIKKISTGRPISWLSAPALCGAPDRVRSGREIGFSIFSGVDLWLPRYTMGRTGSYDSPVF
jgi:hypothetical protein